MFGHCIMGNMGYESLEIHEQSLPRIIWEVKAEQDSGGAGKWRGGIAMSHRLQPIDHDMQLIYCGVGHTWPAFGLYGGEGGEVADHWLLDAETQEIEARLENMGETICRRDQHWYAKTGGGGGFGEPRRRHRGRPRCIFMNTPGKLRDMAELIRKAGAKPEIEAFNPGDILLARRLIKNGHIDAPPLFQICLGVKWSAPADAQSLLYMKGLLPEDAIWSAFGISRWQMEIVALSTILGGHCRVGLEDNIYLERGVFATNAQLVERAARIIRDLGCEVATPDEARKIFGLEAGA